MQTETIVKATARIIRLVIGVKACQIVIEDFSPDSKGVNQLARWVDSEVPIVFTIDGDIRTATKLNKLVLQGKTASPTLTGLKYASDQTVRLMQCVQSESDVEITFKPDTEDMFQAQMEKEDDEETEEEL